MRILIRKLLSQEAKNALINYVLRPISIKKSDLKLKVENIVFFVNLAMITTQKIITANFVNKYILLIKMMMKIRING